MRVLSGNQTDDLRRYSLKKCPVVFPLVQPAAVEACHELRPQREGHNLMPTAQEIREYLEKHGIQNALTAAVNEAIQAKATNPLEFIADALKAKAGSAGAAGGAAQLPPAQGAGSQVVQAAACSTMVSHQVPSFVDASSEAGVKAAAEKDAAAALIQAAAGT